MSTSPVAIPPGPGRPASGGLLWRVVWRLLVGLIALGALAGAAYAGFRFARQELDAARSAVAEEAQAYRAELERRVAELSERVRRAEEAAASAGLLVPTDGGREPLSKRLGEIDAMRQDLARAQADLEQRMAGLQRAVSDALAQQRREADAAVAARLQRQNRLLQAQTYATRALLDLGAGNWGLAREQLRAIPPLLQAVAAEAPAAAPATAAASRAPTDAGAVLRLIDEARVALAGESSAAPELVRMIWVRLGDMLAVAAAPSASPAAPSPTAPSGPPPPPGG